MSFGGVIVLFIWIAIASLLFSLIGCACAGAFASLSWLWMLPVGFAVSFLLLLLVAFLFLLYLCSRVDQNVPQEGDDPLYRKVTNLYIQSLIPVLRVHVKLKGGEKLPAEGRFMLVCNHVSLVDPIMLMYAMPKRQLAFVAKRESRDMFVIGPMMHKLQCQLINRENDKEALKTILRCIQILKEDNASIGVFPEGYILPHRKLHEFRPGVFKIAQKAKVPIVVCTLKDTANAIPNLLHYRPSEIELSVLQVLEYEEFASKKTVEIADEIYRMMAQDLGPDRVAQT